MNHSIKAKGSIHIQRVCFSIIAAGLIMACSAPMSTQPRGQHPGAMIEPSADTYAAMASSQQKDKASEGSLWDDRGTLDRASLPSPST